MFDNDRRNQLMERVLAVSDELELEYIKASYGHNYRRKEYLLDCEETLGILMDMINLANIVHNRRLKGS